MKGYWNMPDETSNTLENGWLHTGDVARMDEDGYFYIVDRKKDMIVASGYNVYPREIEEVPLRASRRRRSGRGRHPRRVPGRDRQSVCRKEAR